MPEEILIIVVMSIFAGTAISIIRMILGFRERKGLRGSAQGSSLTTSELERMMRRVVQEATGPLVDKIDNLEFELATANKPPQLEEARTDLLLDVETEDPEEVSQTVPRKNRVGS